MYGENTTSASTVSLLHCKCHHTFLSTCSLEHAFTLKAPDAQAEPSSNLFGEEVEFIAATTTELPTTPIVTTTQAMTTPDATTTQEIDTITVVSQPEGSLSSPTELATTVRWTPYTNLCVGQCHSCLPTFIPVQQVPSIVQVSGNDKCENAASLTDLPAYRAGTTLMVSIYYVSSFTIICKSIPTLLLTLGAGYA